MKSSESFAQDLLRKKLGEHFDKSKKLNPSFSLRSFARILGLPAGNLSQFMSGKRNFSTETLRSVVEKLIESPEERKNFLEDMNRKEVERIQQAKAAISTSLYDSHTLDDEEFNSIDEWYIYAVRTVLSLKNASSDLDWIAKQVGIDTTEAQRALRVLFKMGLIILSPDGKIVRTNTHIKTPDRIKKKSNITAIMRKIHEGHIRHSLHSLHNHEMNQRDITWVNIPSNPAKLDQARELIRKFQDDMLALLEDEEASEAFRLTVQLCPIKP